MPWAHRAFVLVSALCMLPAVAAAEDPYADFRVPDHHTFLWQSRTLMSSSGAYSGSAFGRGSRSDRNLSLSTSLAWHAESKARQFDVGLFPVATWARSRRQSEESDAGLDESIFKNRDGHQARRQLAEAFYLQPEFSSAHERSDKYYWREVERILRTDGALDGGSIDAFSLERLFEPATRGVFRHRASGASTSLSLAGSDDRFHSSHSFQHHQLDLASGVPVLVSDVSSSGHSSDQRKEAHAVLDMRYSRPMGPRWQSDLLAVVAYGSGTRRTVEYNSSLRIEWLVADRWYASGSLTELSESARIDGARYPPSWQTSAVATLSYWVEDAGSRMLGRWTSASGRIRAISGTSSRSADRRTTAVREE